MCSETSGSCIFKGFCNLRYCWYYVQQASPPAIAGFKAAGIAKFSLTSILESSTMALLDDDSPGCLFYRGQEAKVTLPIVLISPRLNSPFPVDGVVGCRVASQPPGKLSATARIVLSQELLGISRSNQGNPDKFRLTQ